MFVTDKTLANLLKKGLTSLSKAETPPYSPTLKPADLLKTPVIDTLKTPTYYNTLKTLPSYNLLPKSTKERNNAAALAHAELEVMRRLNAEIIKDVAVVASCILDPNYR
ncbi:hypothetical protein K504DRAFT_450485 [Pleomassaria siparia CBS 279.74]|uniref:Uncharacterized protein n=1 Tax=Pleomassaria siparia CBS 279.74 TaxID=1314801 RepID=A0A6G1KLS7_9PLEO|nr:hypothetical protein K504DRAFT_450485 [Pleomassaria siparia CBS 279.74]